jgi:putative ABC transport system ATP-binding protein
MSIIELKNVSKVYPLGRLEVKALDDISFSIAPGEMICVAGPSGCGKTTLLNIVGALDMPSGGEVHIDGAEIYLHNDTELARIRRQKIGFIFQSFNLIPVLSAFENVEYPLILQKMPKGKRKERVERALGEVGIADRAKHRPEELSGGQRQRVAIARAMVTDPEIVLADEPTANLDSRTGAVILDLMNKVNRERNVTFIFSSHDQKIIDRASRIIRLLDGKVVN